VKIDNTLANAAVDTTAPLTIAVIKAVYFATMLYFADVDILTAKEQLGHSDVKTTLQIYTHLDKQHK